MKSNNNSEVPHATGSLHSNTKDIDKLSTNNYSRNSARSQLFNSLTSSIPRFSMGTKFQHEKLAKYILTNYNVITLNGVPHIYMNNGVFSGNSTDIEKIIVQLVPSAKILQIKEVINTLRLTAPARVETDYRYICFENCIVNIETLQTYEFNPKKFIFTSKLNIPYSTDIFTSKPASVEFVNNYFRDISCGDIEIAKLLLQVIAYCIIRTAKYQVGFCLHGEGSNGKSSYLHIIESLLGSYCSHESLGQLSNIRFSTSNLYSCTANIIDDEAQPKNIDTSLIKTIISGGSISAERKGEQAFKFNPYATLIFATNDCIDFKDSSLGMLRRFHIIPFNACFTKDRGNLNVNMTEQICQRDNLQIIAIMALRAFNEVIRTGTFSIPLSVLEATKTYFLESNNVQEFVTQSPIEWKVVKSEYYEEYTTWCTDNNKEPVSNSQFGKEVLHMGYRSERLSRDGTRSTYYVSSKFDKNKDSDFFSETANISKLVYTNELGMDLTDLVNEQNSES